MKTPQYGTVFRKKRPCFQGGTETGLPRDFWIWPEMAWIEFYLRKQQSDVFQLEHAKNIQNPSIMLIMNRRQKLEDVVPKAMCTEEEQSSKSAEFR